MKSHNELSSPKARPVLRALVAIAALALAGAAGYVLRDHVPAAQAPAAQRPRPNGVPHRRA